MTDRSLDAWLAEHLFDIPEAVVRGLALGASPYSSTGDGMLHVLEAMRKREWRALMGTWSTGPGYRCQFYTITNEEGVSALADSLPLAVALSAKAALEASA